MQRSQPYACPLCSKRMSDLHGRELHVYHGESSPSVLLSAHLHPGLR